jgi:hypothetical protein
MYDEVYSWNRRIPSEEKQNFGVRPTPLPDDLQLPVQRQ